MDGTGHIAAMPPPGAMRGDYHRVVVSRPSIWTAERAALAAVLCLAAVLRLAMVPRAGVYHPDELYQYWEQAHRLLFGHGIVTWEYRYGMRSWLLPLGLAPWMALGQWLAPSSALYLLLPRAVLAALSLGIVAAAWRIGRPFGETHAVLTAGVAAIWPEFVYLAPHALSETVSIALILPAAALLAPQDGEVRPILAGVLLGLAAVLRMQHLPAEAALAILSTWRRPRTLMLVVGGGALALAGCALVDAAMGQAPFGWAVEYVRLNVLDHRADRYGTAPWWAYAWAIGQSFGWLTWPLLALAAVGARRCPILFRVALVNLAVHMAIPHKEYRFVLLTTAILPLLAAIGTAELVLATRRARPPWAPVLPWLALGGWAAASAAQAASGRLALFALPDDGRLALYGELRRDAGMCGLGLAVNFTRTGGYAYLHRPVPIYAYLPGETARMRRDADGYNRLFAPAATPLPPGFHAARCNAGGTCIFTRPGPCRALSSLDEINRRLARQDL